MFTEDFILRLINQATNALLKIIKLKKSGDYPEAQQTIDQALEGLLGLRADIIKQLDNDSILNTLTQYDKLDVDRLALVADLFKEEGDILLAQIQEKASLESYLRSLVFYLETGFCETSQPSADLTKKIEMLLQNIEIQYLPDDALWTLFCYYEQIRAYPKADDTISKLAARPGLYSNIKPELFAFYERLLEMPIAELAAAGMNQEEIMSKLVNV